MTGAISEKYIESFSITFDTHGHTDYFMSYLSHTETLFFPPDQEDFYQISPGSVVKTLGSTDEKYETPDIFRIKYFYGFWTSDQLP